MADSICIKTRGPHCGHPGPGRAIDVNLATLAGCGAIALWAILGVLSRAAATIPPFQLTAMSFAVSAIVSLSLLGVRGRLGHLRQPPLAWLHGVLGLFGFHALYFAALAHAPAAQANLINYTWPLLIVLLSALLPGMRLTARHLAGVALAASGCLLLLGGNAGLSAAYWPGYVAALASAMTWAVYSVLARHLAAVPTDAVAGFCAATAILAALAHAIFEPTIWPDPIAALAILALGLGPVGAAFFLWDIGMKRGDPRLLGTLAYATPVASTLLLCAAGFAPFTAATLIAAALVATGGLIATR
jgi:drug/metabolite transporter (DMT)-like permease